MFNAIAFHLSTIVFHHSTIEPQLKHKNRLTEAKLPAVQLRLTLAPPRTASLVPVPLILYTCTQDSKPQGIRRFSSGEIYEDEIYS
jgi:hypothetical protein